MRPIRRVGKRHLSAVGEYRSGAQVFPRRTSVIVFGIFGENFIRAAAAALFLLIPGRGSFRPATGRGSQPISVNILRSILPTHHDAPSPAAAPPPPPEPSLLLVGEDLAWIKAGTTVAGRRVVHAASKDEALAALDAQPFDGMIAALPEMGKNFALLNAASSRHPSLACGLRAEPAAAAKLAVSHPVLAPTQSLEIMEDLVRTMFATVFWSANPAFATLKEHIKRFPALPTLFTQITEAIKDPNSSLASVADLVSREPTVSAKLLQVVNSPVFALRQRITSVRDAANFLGFQRLRALVLATSLFGQCNTCRCGSFSPENFEKRSLRIADWASQITLGETRDRELAEMSFTGGVLHQFGMLLLAANLPEGYDQVLCKAAAQKVNVAHLERETYGVTHAELAGYIFAAWSIPFPILNAVGFYALPSSSEDTEFTPLTAVHIANAIETYATLGVEDFDRGYLARLGLLPRLSHWSKILTGKDWPLA
jgi:HD-like signal output (HDOD) protein